jgi:hypothetical protein
VIIWHVLANHALYDELGGDYFHSRDTAAETRRHVNALRRRGHDVPSPQPPEHHDSGSGAARA